jgi:hypothetical protein
MIRPFTLLCFLSFAVAGAWLYQVKHQVALKDRELVEIRRQTEQARQRMDILRAEWALLNEPDRLRQNAMRVLSLEPMQPQHFARPTDIERRLPGAIAFAGAPDLFAAPPVPEPPRGAQPPVMLASAPVAAVVTRAATPAATPAVVPGGRMPEAPAPQALAAALAAQRADQTNRAAPPMPRPAPPSAPTALASPAPRAVQQAVHVTPAAAAAEPVTRVTRAAPPETTFVSALGGASALGRPSLAPPVPVGSASAATLGVAAR